MKLLTPTTLIIAAIILGCSRSARATTNLFFNAAQTMTVTASNMTAVTINSEGYLFTYSQDGYFTGGLGGGPIGRFFSVVWPNGVQAQASTAGPLVGNGANITIRRADGKRFDLQSFTGKILLNTAGAGGAFEITPQLNGNDAPGSPFQYDCSGYAGMSFPYTTSLISHDAYIIHMWGDFALTALTLTDTNPIVPSSGITNTIAASAFPVGAGSVGGAGDYASNTVCRLTATASPGWGFKNWTQNGTQVSSSSTYSFTVRSNRTLTANFVPAYTVITTVAPGYGGTASGDGTYTSNAAVSVHATVAAGFQFVNWTDYGTPVSTATNYSFTITGNHSLAANFIMQPQTALFDFDTGWPAVGQGQGMPGSQSNNWLTAHFSTLAGGWSMQTRQSSVIGVNPVFSGSFLYPGTWGSAFQIQFSAPVTDVAFDFTTGEVSSEYDLAGTVRLIAYTNSTPVATNLARGNWISGAYPEGHLSFHSATPFTAVKIDVAPIAPSSALLFVDNIVAQRAAVQGFSVTAAASPTNAGFVSGTGSYAGGATADLIATPNLGYVFTGWRENGTTVETLPYHSFTVSTNHALIAVFTTNTPPIALGGGFYQLTNTPLAINILDLMAFDSDPDGDLPFFTGTSATTARGLLLTNDGWQIFIPANSRADSFTYTISDGNGGSATGTAILNVITNPVGNPVSLDLTSAPGTASVSFSGVPWYYYTIQRATNAAFTGTVQAWSAQAWADGFLGLWDDFADLGGLPMQSFYRLAYP